MTKRKQLQGVARYLERADKVMSDRSKLVMAVLLHPPVALLCGPLGWLWEPSKRRSRENENDLRDGMVVSTFILTPVAFGLAGLVGEIPMGEPYSSIVPTIFAAMGVILMGHLVGWCVGEMLTGHRVGNAMDHSGSTVLSCVRLHGVIGWLAGIGLLVAAEMTL